MKPARSRVKVPTPVPIPAPAPTPETQAAHVPTAAEPAALYGAAVASEPVAEAGTLPDLQPQAVAVATARQHFAHYMRRSAEAGEVFLIRNGRSADAPSALLISPQTLARHLAEPPRTVRTLGTVLESLPFRRRGVPRARAVLHDAEAAPPLVLPGAALPGAALPPAVPVSTAMPAATAPR